ncbi:kinesin [Cryptococcus deuterogattii 99/473]|uniref:Kinesin n=1 Tax=Cryptococcus deuterogattii Ram5 TaxID=1296110 RepID=A0A0D0TQ69_9TREE|nr:kinesin [Cryptococcus deuterogattii Ram5]KIY54886.1 kinesin [Cryptococcus deuterogattii 99/473]
MSGNNIKVVCRFRPMNRMEIESKSEQCVDITEDHTAVQLRNKASLAGPEKDGFTFDRVFDTTTRQDEIFDWGVKGIVEDVMTGFNGTLFCYGQTGSGKTFTMMGADIENPSLRGIIPRIVEQIFASILSADSSIEYTVKVSYMEIYMERIKDLLAPQNDNLSIHEDKQRGVYVKNLTDVYVGSEEDVYRVMKAGGASRAVSSTNMNAESSRSHSIFVIGIHQRNTETGSQKSGNLYLVDLAGSEKVGKTGATGQTLEEAKKINKSLSALGMVINALTDGKSQHVPYRDSKLTRILQESLGGNSRTTLIINCSPASFNEAETLSTLRFGMRAKSIKNKARVNVEMSPAELKALLKKTQAELVGIREWATKLEEEAKIWRSGGKVEQTNWAPALNQALAGGGAAANVAKRAMAPPPPPTPSSSSASRAATPGGALGAIDGSRPDTPSTFSLSLDKDEREEFLKRENELSDQLAEKESALAAQEKVLADLKEEIAYFKDQESAISQENKTMSFELSELRISSARLESEAKDATITLDSYKEKIAELQKDIEDQKTEIENLKHAHTREKEEEKEKRKQEMLNEMMSKIDLGNTLDSSSEKLRAVLREFEETSDVERKEKLTSQTRELIRTSLAESQDAMRGLQERLRLACEEQDMQVKRRSELEKMLEKRDAAFEELLEKTASGQSISFAEIKSSLETKYSSREELLRTEISTLSDHVESRAQDVRRLQSTVESYKLSNEELNRALTAATIGTDGETFASSAKELERARKAHEIQYAEFEMVKKSLMKDLQNRCEKVVELEMQLDEVREQYKIIARSANSRAQQRKLEFLEHNLEQLSAVQKQLVEQNTSFKKEVAESQRKLMSRNDRIQNLEAALSNADQRLAQKNQKYEQQIQLFREKLAEAQAKQNATYAHGRIAKPLRGGGGAQTGVVGGIQGIMGGGKQEESPSGKRQSWFFSPQQR